MNPLRALFLSLSRMHPAVMLIIILGLAVVVTMMVMGQLGESEKKAAEQKAALEAKYNQKVMVVFATKDVPEGATIASDALEEKEVESGRAPIDALTSQSLAVGRIAKATIPAGQIVGSHDLVPEGVSVGFESHIKAGMRAVTFGIDTNSGVAGFIAPDSHVDIIGSVGSGRETKANPILSDVKVIAVGTVDRRTTSGGAIQANSITVEVAPPDANKLVKAVTAGKLYLTLRNDKDHTPVAVVDVTSMFEKPMDHSDMASLPPPPAPLAPPPPMGGDMGGGSTLAPAEHEIETWSGSKKEVISVPRN